MKTRLRIAAIAVCAAFVAGGALAQSAVEGAIKARKSHMQLYAHNLGGLGAMAKGEAPYDAAAASAMAGNIAALVTLDQSRYWLPGSAQGEAADTRALPAIWQDGGVMEKAAALNQAVAALNAAAGNGLEGLQAAMGPVGQACGGCHKAYRATE